MQSRTVPLRGEGFAILVADFESAFDAALRAAGDDPSAWTRGRPGRWTAGQHLDHLAVSLAVTLAGFEQAVARMRDGTLPPVPMRGPLQALFVALVVKRGSLPRGGRTPAELEAAPSPDRAAVIERTRTLVRRYRALGETLTPAERDRVWIPNPFRSSWHYTYPESLRMHAVHARHHARLAREAAGA